MWFAAGLLVGAALVILFLQLKRINVTVKWYEWLIGIIGMLVVVYGLQNVFALAESESSTGAPGTFFLLFALPGIIFLLVAIGLPSIRFITGKYYSRGGQDAQEA